MKKYTTQILNLLLAGVLVSCTEKDEINCSKLQSDFLEKIDIWGAVGLAPSEFNVDDGIDGVECAAYLEWKSEYNKVSDDLIATIRKSKSCDFMDLDLASGGYLSIEDLIDVFENSIYEIQTLYADVFTDC